MPPGFEDLPNEDQQKILQVMAAASKEGSTLTMSAGKRDSVSAIPIQQQVETHQESQPQTKPSDAPLL